MKESENPLYAESFRKLATALSTGQIDVGRFKQEIEQLDQQSNVAATKDYDVDLDRRRRYGQAEVVFGSGKSFDALNGIFGTLLDHGQDVFATRIEPDMASRLCQAFPEGRFHAVSATFRIDASAELTQSDRALSGNTLVITAGTSDLPVAEEARQTLDWMRVGCQLIVDVGVAGPHRLASRADELLGRDAIVVVAGMEGALPSVVAGYVDCPVIAVPTSVGYGAAFGGIAALLSMLNSCAANVAVVNIDAGFKAGYIAAMIARRKADRA